MENKFTLSIIIPARNEAETLPHLLEALQKQTFKPIEIIVVDSASIDNTTEVAKSFGVITLREEIDGTNQALESGRERAKGDLIGRIDADCIPDPDWAERAVAHFNNPKVVALAGPYDYYDGDHTFRTIALYFQKYVYTIMNIFLRTLRSGGVLIGGNSMMRSTAMNAIGGFDRRIKFYGDDTDLAKRISKKGVVVFDRNLLMKSSARRFHTVGLINTMWEYLKGFAKATLHS